MVQARNGPVAHFLALVVFCKSIRFACGEFALGFPLQPKRKCFAKPAPGFPAVLELLSGKMGVQGHGCVNTCNGALSFRHIEEESLVLRGCF